MFIRRQRRKCNEEGGRGGGGGGGGGASYHIVQLLLNLFRCHLLAVRCLAKKHVTIVSQQLRTLGFRMCLRAWPSSIQTIGKGSASARAQIKLVKGQHLHKLSMLGQLILQQYASN